MSANNPWGTAVDPRQQMKQHRASQPCAFCRAPALIQTGACPLHTRLYDLPKIQPRDSTYGLRRAA